MVASWKAYDLDFRFEAITSRDRMWHKRTYFVYIPDSNVPGGVRVGECPVFKGLSADDVPNYEDILSEHCKHPEEWRTFAEPSIRFGFEMALTDFAETDWSRGKAGIPINGLVWMGDRETMASRIADKLDNGYRVLKLKIGGINFDDELDLLRLVRSRFSASSLEIRLDANGAFTPSNALERLEALSRFDIHSIEQPIKAGQWTEMQRICACSPIPIALDEELIGLRNRAEVCELLDAICPAYVILKPALIGGFEASDVYIEEAQRRNMGWWATSALESNVGLYAIGRWLSQKNLTMPQGLGTGQLYSNNTPSPLYISGDELRCHES